jgi:hypothetical protein
MNTRNFIEETIRRFGKPKFQVPISELVNPESDLNLKHRIGNAYSIGGILESAKRRMLAQNPIVPNSADIINAIIYDTYKIAANTSIGAAFTFFTVPIGTSGKTKMDTNMEQVSRLPDPQWFNALSLGFSFGPEVNLADQITVLNNYYMEFWVGGKSYLEGRFDFFPSGNGVTGSYYDTTATTKSSLVTNGVPNYNNLFDLRLPAGMGLGVQRNPDTGANEPVVADGLIGVTILQGQNFSVKCSAPGGAQSTASGGAGLRMIAQLYGILSRSVQ